MIPGDKTVDPSTGVFYNLANIRDDKTLREYEYHRTAFRELELRENPIKGDYGLEHLQKIHGHLFQDVFPWAGQLREINFSKYNAELGGHGLFAKTEEFDQFKTKLAYRMRAHNGLENLKKAEFVNAMADMYQGLNELHPFREGNGRATKLMLQQLAAERGYVLDYTKVPKDEWNRMAAGSLMVVDRQGELVTPGEIMPLRDMFNRIAEPTTAHVFKVYPKEEAIKLRPELEASFSQLDKVAQSATVLYGPERAAALVQEERSRIQGTLETGSKIELAISVVREREEKGYDREPTVAANRPIAAAFKLLPRQQAETIYPELKGAFRSIDAAEKHAKLTRKPAQRAVFVEDARRMIYNHLLRHGRVPEAAQALGDQGKGKPATQTAPVRQIKTPERGDDGR